MFIHLPVAGSCCCQIWMVGGLCQCLRIKERVGCELTAGAWSRQCEKRCEKRGAYFSTRAQACSGCLSPLVFHLCNVELDWELAA